MKRNRGLCVISLVIGLAAAAGLGSCIAGCAMITPHTQVGFDPARRMITFYDSKDNDVELDNVAYSPDGGFTLEKLIISNKSTPVIEANVQQMLAFVEQQKAANEGIAVTLSGLANIVGQLSGVVTELQGVLRAMPSVSANVQAGTVGGSVNVTPSTTEDCP